MYPDPSFPPLSDVLPVLAGLIGYTVMVERLSDLKQGTLSSVASQSVYSRSAEAIATGPPCQPCRTQLGKFSEAGSCIQACISLNGMYEKARAEGRPSQNEGEFRAYHLLNLMGSHGGYKYNATEYRKALKVGKP